MQEDRLVQKWFDLMDLLESVVVSIPLLEELEDVLEKVREAEKRGYFKPSEEEVLYLYYTRYLRNRVILLELIEEVRLVLGNENLKEEEKSKFFTVGYYAGLVLLKAGRFIVRLAEGNRVVRVKLDQAESRFGLEWKSFSRLYRKVVGYRSYNQLVFAAGLYREKSSGFRELAKGDEAFSGLLDLVDAELGLFEEGRFSFVLSRLKYRWFSFRRRGKAVYKRAMFQIFKLSGSSIAELKQPHLAKDGKCVGPEIIAEVKPLLKRGDILITRHEDALSNLFLPGFWPHAALYLGIEEGDVVEAKKDGVLVRTLTETLAVDAFIVLRSGLSEKDLDSVEKNALSHVGKSYDFVFDFSASDRLACTEVVYRSFHGIAGIEFDLVEKAGRKCLPAEELMTQSIDSGKFEVVVAFIDPLEGVLEGGEALRAYESKL